MSPPAYLSRVRLRRDQSVAALAPLLLPADDDQRVGAAHRLLWALFADGPSRRRDFLWREIDGERIDRLAFLLLSSRPPEDSHGLFEIDPPKPWAPSLRPGDRLGFSLRANPVRTTAGGSGRTRRHDVVMHELHAVPAGDRGEARRSKITEAGLAWLEAQGQRHGFRPSGVPRVDGYAQRRIPRGDGRPIRFSTLDLDGELEVTEPEPFLATVRLGFGKAKAFGCGLMLLRRLP